MPSLTTAQHADFHRAFIACLLWSSSNPDNEDRHLNEDYEASDFHPLVQEALRAKSEEFARENAADLLAACQTTGYEMANAGHDFALSSNGHGAGYFDRNLDEIGDRLQAAAEASGEIDAYVGDDGLLYVSGMEEGIAPRRNSMRP